VRFLLEVQEVLVYRSVCPVDQRNFVGLTCLRVEDADIKLEVTLRSNIADIFIFNSVAKWVLDNLFKTLTYLLFLLLQVVENLNVVHYSLLSIRSCFEISLSIIRTNGLVVRVVP
jgi:hypothetical protein